MKLKNRKEDAVSPVIGVMLMLVVTVVIAAVVVMFATGTAGDSTATTPMALFEVETPLVSGGVLQSFDLVHKGGDQMALENLQLTLEPLGGEYQGIILERTATPFKENGAYSSDYGLIEQYIEYADMMSFSYTLETTEGTGAGLTVRGKTGDDVVVSTGDRIKVGVKLQSGGATLSIPDFRVSQSASQYIIPESSPHSNIPLGTAVKWTLSDTRTNGVIAKGEFVVPKA